MMLRRFPEVGFTFCRVLGAPTEELWQGVTSLPDHQSIFPKFTATPWEEVCPTLDPAGLDLLKVFFDQSISHSNKQHTEFVAIRPSKANQRQTSTRTPLLLRFGQIKISLLHGCGF